MNVNYTLSKQSTPTNAANAPQLMPNITCNPLDDMKDLMMPCFMELMDDTKDDKKATKAAHATIKKHLDACAATHSNQEVAPAMDQVVRDAIEALNVS